MERRCEWCGRVYDDYYCTGYYWTYRFCCAKHENEATIAGRL